ncbi:MAG: hypothetical protein ACD_79C00256G0003 [uncultured bacterium]|nr:MAG: hypothetical protein ACD_79C00256G0003 [uncultured bacterium]
MRARFLKTNTGEDVINGINVTPLVDVSLTVLVIFILIAPIMEQGISINLPKATADKVKSKEALTVEVDKTGRIFLDATQVSLYEFQQRIKSIASFNAEQSILIRADQENKYGSIVKIIDIIKQAGLTKMGILTRPEDKI